MGKEKIMSIRPYVFKKGASLKADFLISENWEYQYPQNGNITLILGAFSDYEKCLEAMEEYLEDVRELFFLRLNQIRGKNVIEEGEDHANKRPNF
jgi:hypothetical protein